MDTPAPEQLPSLDILLEHQLARLADVRDRIARMGLQQTDIAQFITVCSA